MVLRILSILAALAGSFGIAAWAVGPRGDSGMSSGATKGDRLLVDKSAIRGSSEGASNPGPAEFRDAAAARAPAPASSRFDTALLNPTATVPVRPEPVRPPVAKEVGRTDHRPFKCPRTAAPSSDVLTVAQIARIKTALNLTPSQEKDWRPVETGLAAMARQIENARANGRKIMIPAEQTQNLYLAAGPLVLSLREEQKRDARNLACSLGLGAVAALI